MAPRGNGVECNPPAIPPAIHVLSIRTFLVQHRVRYCPCRYNYYLVEVYSKRLQSGVRKAMEEDQGTSAGGGGGTGAKAMV